MTTSTAPSRTGVYLRQWQIIGSRKHKTCAPILNISSATFWRWVNDPRKGFPRPYKLSARVTAWKAEEIFAWLDARNSKQGAST